MIDLFLDTVNPDEIKNYLPTGVIKGVTSNPTLLWKEKKAVDKQLEEIAACQPDMLFVQLVGETVDELAASYEELKNRELGVTIGLKINMNQVGLEFVHQLKTQKVEEKILGTAIYSAEQGILGTLAGCDYLAPYINRMSNVNIDPYHVIKQIREFIDSREASTQIMGASFKNIKQVLDALSAGAHTATIPADVFEGMVNNPLATDAIHVFNTHGKELSQF
ncbi:transaldolase family protein [Alkalibacterium sp. MB6]|uniref:transaldolase family protein n=1 Tax=Alkalibacterium sp. MB6 TaxID=2081965 RepID=UPI001F249B90|nr:transaldolase family protein [Alkalibacterium sp. MB6]